MGWLYRIKLKHLMTEDEDLETVQRNMNAIADELAAAVSFLGFDIGLFREIPEGDDVFGPVDYANVLLDAMYDYADSHRIWIE